jgi:hypothetical protein
VNQWRLISTMDEQEQAMVVLPSISVDTLFPPTLLQAYEERFLFILWLLRKPRARIIYVTSSPIQQEVIDYYIGLLPGIIPTQARCRLFQVAVHDASSRPLTEKLLQRPRIVEQIRKLIPDPATTHLVPFITTRMERELAVRLGIPMFGADPDLLHLGTKTGCRRLFAEEGLAHPFGREGLHGEDEVVSALCAMRAEKPGLGEVLIKLDEGVSGQGNALIDLSGVPPQGSAGEQQAMRERLWQLQPEHPDLDASRFMPMVRAGRCVLEERIRGQDLRSPSVQLRITPLGEVELLSTHDQLLGGRSGQSYEGCLFPAQTDYATIIAREAEKLGRRLVREGVVGRCAVDFVVVRDTGGTWFPYAIEVNLRKGGTTHPFLTLEFLTSGRYDPDRAVFTAPSGRQKFYVSTDHLHSPLFMSLTLGDLFDFLVMNKLHFDQATQTGVVLQMMTALTEHGEFGITAVGDSPQQARELFERTRSGLEEEARRVL